MKKFILAAACIFALGTSLSAQCPAKTDSVKKEVAAKSGATKQAHSAQCCSGKTKQCDCTAGAACSTPEGAKVCEAHHAAAAQDSVKACCKADGKHAKAENKSCCKHDAVAPQDSTKSCCKADSKQAKGEKKACCKRDMKKGEKKSCCQKK
ncbi:hypothetical protein [Porphyromonas sp.]